MEQYDQLSNKSKVRLSLADHNLNSNFIKGFDRIEDIEVTLINNMQIPNFPQYPKIFWRAENWKHCKNANDVNCGFINIVLLKHISRFISTYIELNYILSAHKENNIFLIVYDLHWGINMAVKWIKKKFPLIHTSIILPDLPNEVLATSSEGKITSLHKLKARIKTQFIKNYDSYIFLTDYMSEIIDITNKKCTVIEGIYDESQKALPLKEDEEEKIIVYSGQLNPIYGIGNLIEAFMKIWEKDSRYKLWICGGGGIEQRIKDLQNVCSGIKLWGYVNTQKVREIQSRATVLVNPRQNTDIFTKYSFPSKTMEYLASGRPVIGYRLDGIPEEYYKYIQLVNDNSVDALKDKIVEVCSLPADERNRIGMTAREFIVREKNPRVQCQKVKAMWEL